MPIDFQSLGAVQEVTGSCHLIRVGERRLLLDCGMFQGGRNNAQHNRDPFLFDPATIDAVILSHAHIDHSGRIPILVSSGFRGPIYTHPATKDLARILLKDSAFLHEKETEWENRKRERKGLPLVEPLYTQQDAATAMRQFKVLHYARPTKILPGVTVCLHDAGHILGSAIVELKLSDAGVTRTVVFSGDLGHIDAPILRDPVRLERADLVVMESTYGDRLHRPWDATREELIEVIAAARHDKGNILIPSFVVGRSQLLLYWFARYFKEANLENWQIFLDSPLAIEASNIYVRHSSLYDEAAAALWAGLDGQPLLPNLRLTRTTKQSKAINRFHSGAIIIAGSGMCTGGRIKHHLLNNVWRKQCHVIIVGYQAYGTPGRAMVDGAKHIRLYGDTVRVAAKVHTVGGLSAHADQNGLLNWYKCFSGGPRVLLVHGE
ncbi:MAG: MBL fold metallo-hydrolase RNA specificity domain-containing protein, partial [Pseudomonadales bacterium]